jgi:DNA-directed RNA polymerase subunit RPC12/RpoP
MSDTPASTKVQLLCTQCGGELHPDQGQIFLTCPYCSSTVYLDKSIVVFHWYLAPTLDETKARHALFRWMAGNQTVKDLDKKAQLVGVTFQYFPLWYFKRRQSNGKEEILLEPAAAISVSELRQVRLPAGDLRKYESRLDAEAVAPTVPLEAAEGWLEERKIPKAELVERAVVHIPLYAYKYRFQGTDYLALVEAGTGGTYASIYPAKAEAPYQTIAVVSALIFLCLATFPILGILAGGENGFMIGTLACLGGGILAAPLLLAAAAWIAAKI